MKYEEEKKMLMKGTGMSLLESGVIHTYVLDSVQPITSSLPA